MVAKIHTICQDDTRHRPGKHDDRQVDNTRIPGRIRSENSRYFHLGARRSSSDRNDKNGQRQRPE